MRGANAPQSPDATPDGEAPPAGDAVSGEGATLTAEGARVQIPAELPILPVKGMVIFPGTVVPIHVERDKSKRLIDAVLGGDKLLAVFTQRSDDVEDPAIDDMYRVGTASAVLKLLRMPDGENTLLVHGLVRVGLEQIVQTEPYWRALVHPREDAAPTSLELEALVYAARRAAERIIELSPNVPDEARQILATLEKPGVLADFLAANLSLGVVQKQELLETFDVPDRLRKVNATLQNQVEVLVLAQKIQDDVKTQIDKTQREYFLHEQLRAIQKELGERDARTGELDELRQRVAAAKMPELVAREADRELKRLDRLPQVSPEYGVIRDYLEWLVEMPWTQQTDDNLDLDRAAEILDADHYGLERVKRRILEYLAVRKLTADGRGPILCFVGPPGVGKTSLGQSISRSLGRKFIRIALGGVRDEADIRGHRRTYIGAIPGRLVQEIRKCGARNPVLMLDELDKVGADFRGDPAAALLEVLDPEQNHSFTDHYLGVPFDLSHVLFIATANYLDPVAPALRDRMEVIELPGYTTAEKLEIAKRYLVPKQLERNGLKGYNVTFDDAAIKLLIEGYTLEAGVRKLEQNIGAVCRGLAAKIARGAAADVAVNAADLEEYLNPPRFEREQALRTSVPGVATGLAYTPVGGELIFVEATQMPGRGVFQLTGQLGEVMRESATAALSLVRARARDWGIPLRELTQHDIHIHVPAGGVPKDGPSAGVAILTALVSLLLDRTALPTVAMTGEITLRGLVLPIGGVKEKVLAAHRAGIRTVILPKRNEPDLFDVPKEVRHDLEFIFAERVEEVLNAALPPSEKAADSAPRPRRVRRPSQAAKRRRPGRPDRGRGKRPF